jgi:hypothetical protein
LTRYIRTTTDSSKLPRLAIGQSGGHGRSPERTGTGVWGLGVVEADDEETLHAFAASDPVVTTQTAHIEMGKLLAGVVRPSPTVA